MAGAHLVWLWVRRFGDSLPVQLERSLVRLQVPFQLSEFVVEFDRVGTLLA